MNLLTRASLGSRVCRQSIRRYASAEKGLVCESCSDVKPRLEMTPVEAPSPKKASVTLLAANDMMGHTAALSLKLDGGDVGEVRLWDYRGSLRGVALELSHIPTSVRVVSYIGEGQLQASLRKSDIVVVMGSSWGLPSESSSDLFYKNADHVRELAKAIIVAAPRAMIGIAVPPITSIVAFFGEMQREHGTFCPNRLFGVLSMEEMRAKTIVANRLGIPPTVTSVSLTGGGTPATLVPVISSATPGGDYLKNEAVDLTIQIRSMTEKIKHARDGKGPDATAGVGVANFVRAVAKGMYGGGSPTISAVVRTSCLHGVPYLALPVTLGTSGIVGTVGIPRLSKQELRLLIKALPAIMEDISIGETWAHASRQAAIAAQ